MPLHGMGLAVADYDNDGDHDILVTGYQRNLFFSNNGNGTFTDTTQRVGIKNGAWGSGAAFFDYDRDGYLDLVISNYVEWTPALESGLDCTYGTPMKDYCPVRYFRGQGLMLYHNRGDGTFEEVTQRAGVSSQGTRAFAPYIFDFNSDQWPDIFVSSDGTPSLLYRNQGDGTFVEMGVRSGIVLDETGAAYAGMGIDATYPKNDAQLCIAIGNFVGEPTTLHCSVRQGDSYHPELYAEVSSWAGIGRPTLRYVTFGLFFFDVDLDGFEDLFMVNGHVIDEANLRNAPRAQRPQLFLNQGDGKFREFMPAAGSGLDQVLVGRGAAYADYDHDGDLDILVSQNQGTALLLRNDTPRQNHYLRVHLQGSSSNRDGIGAEVQVSLDGQILKQMLRSGRSYYSQNELTLTFGLGKAEKTARIDILWPSGIVDVYRDVPADTTLRAVEGSHPKDPAQGLTTAPALPAPERPSTALPSASTSQAFLKHTHEGIDTYQANRYAESAQAFETARELRPTDPLAYRYLADIYWRQGAPEQAAHMVRSLAAVMPDAYFLDRVGTSYEEAELPGLARLFYEEAVRVDPGFPSARYNLGRAYLNRGELARGISEVQEVLRLYPAFPGAHHTLGLAYTEQGDFDLAITYLQRALTLQPNLAAARNHLGRIYMAQGRLDEAIETFQDLVGRRPEVAEARHNLAVAYARRGRQQEAITQFREAVRLQPDLHAARIDLASLFLEIQRPLEAIKALQAVIAAVSTGTQDSTMVDPVDVHYRLSIAFLMAGQLQKAIGELAGVIREQPAHAGAHTYLGRIYYQTGQYDQAWKHTRRAEALGVPVEKLIAALSRVSAEPQ
jgi:tetratricopeptide (TPR) repeat protein